jgi:hypothetical protein
MAFKGSYSDYVSDVNTDGTIDSRVKANPDYGFSIVSYTGTGSAATVGHGLSSAPEMVITKARNDTTYWIVNHKDLTSGTSNLYLQSTSTQQADGNWTAVPTSSVLNLGVASVNQTSDNYISYCWHSVADYSSFGSYTGTGAAGNAVTGLGFEPAFLMVKGADVGEHWVMFDNTRSPTNPVDQYFLANTTNAEETGSSTRAVDFDADGFTVNGTQTEVNQSGGTYIYMAFADTREAAFWKDVSGQGNHWTPNNLDYRDSLIDSPANNFAVLNPLAKAANSSTAEGNLYWSSSTTVDGNIAGTVGMSSGKYYFEVLCKTDSTGSDVFVVGIGDNQIDLDDYLGNSSGGYAYDGFDGFKGNNGTRSSYGASWDDGDIIGVAFDADSGSLTFYKNNVSQGVAFGSIPSGTYLPVIGDGSNAGVVTYVANFGQDSTFSGAKPMGAYTDDNSIGNFQYAPPAGYLALCTQNLPTPTIVDGSEHFNTVLYTGTGASTLSITGVGFQPDWVWAKKRSAADNHAVADVVRGVTKSLFPNTTGAESTDVNGLQSFDTDGFTIGSGSGSGVWGGNSGATYAAWNWKAGGTAVSNTSGSITSQVSANVDAGFSILSWTTQSGAFTTGHGLSQAPEMFIEKNRTGANNWTIYHKGVASDAATDYLLFTTAAAADDDRPWNDTAPTSTVIHHGNGWHSAGQDMIGYAFHSVDGFSKVGSYTGNGSTDGPFIYTGFRPAWVLFKRSDSGTHHWRLFDAARSTFNKVDDYLAPSNSNAEAVGKDVDFVSNGVKIRATNTDLNTSGGTYIYLAFAENPFKYANAR